MPEISAYASNYETMTQIGHVLERPTTYLGGNVFKKSEELVYFSGKPAVAAEDTDNKMAIPAQSPKIEARIIDYMPLIERTYLEITSNAADNRLETERALLNLQNLTRSPNEEDLREIGVDLDELDQQVPVAGAGYRERMISARAINAAYQKLQKTGRFPRKVAPGLYIEYLTQLEDFLRNPVDHASYGIEDGKALAPESDDLVTAIETLRYYVMVNPVKRPPTRQEVVAAGVEPGNIEVDLSPTLIRVKNYGRPMPTGWKNDELTIPHYLFGTMLTSSKFTQNRDGAGTNGIGAKATNIFSTFFRIVVDNAESGEHYEITWRNNMSQVEGPFITPFKGEISSTCIEYTLDFARLGTDGYSADMLDLFRRHAADMSFTSGATVIVNGVPYDYQEAAYAALYGDDVADSKVVSHCNDGLDGNTNVRMYILDRPDGGKYQSFVNGMLTNDGGIHVDSAYESFGRKLMTKVNDEYAKKLKGSEEKLTKITIADIKKHFTVVVAVRVDAPTFNSQSKTKLEGPKVKIVVDEKVINALLRFSAFKRLKAEIEAKQKRSIKKISGKKARYITSLKAIDANMAGTRDSMKCALYVTEGDSGQSYLDGIVGLTKTTRDFMGVMPLKGKGLNVMKATAERITSNTEIVELFKVLGLKSDADYTKLKERKSLRYGKLVIAADADVDGQHIVGLILSFFYCMFPTLLEVNKQCPEPFLWNYLTPILRVKVPRTISESGKPEVLTFYTEGDYVQWRQSFVDPSKCKHTYYKGLGSSSPQDIIEDFKTPHLASFVMDPKTDQFMHLAFDPKMADQRKHWIRTYEDQGLPFMSEMPISTFIDQNLIRFSIADLDRSVPSLMDGMKVSQRKVIYGALQLWSGAAIKKDVKTSQAASSIASKTSYHHADGHLAKVITRMAQSYIGSNNLALFEARAQFGTRLKGGRDAGDPRYTKTRPSPLMRMIYRAADNPILEMTEDEGVKAEPKTFMPIIPMLLVNVTKGIATGWSTDVPTYNPLDLIEWLHSKLTDAEDQIELIPWFKGFKGRIRMIDHKRMIKPQSESAFTPEHLRLGNRSGCKMADDDEYFVEEGHVDKIIRHGLATYGSYSVDSKGVIHITELPIGVVPIDYLKWLESLIAEKKIKEMKDHSHGDVVSFSIEGWEGKHSHKILRLISNMSLTNMTVLVDGKPYRFGSANSIMEAFYARRLQAYKDRHQYELGVMKKELQNKKELLEVIRAIVDERVDYRRATAVVMKDLAELGLNPEHFKKLAMSSCTADRIPQLEKIIEKKRDAYNEYKTVDPKDIWIDELYELQEKLLSMGGYEEQIRAMTKQMPKD